MLGCVGVEAAGALTFGSLFSGIGGLDLGLERAGMEVRWQSEVDPYCSRVLAKHWPSVPNLGDVTQVDWSTVERVDLICGGFPCQPFSTAGKGLGDQDPRYLWPEVARALSVLRPRYAILENVPGLIAAPEFGRVIGDLADLGYDAEWDCIPAAAVGAPHLRYRVFVVAYPSGVGRPDGQGFAGGPGLVGVVVGTDGRGKPGDSAARGSVVRRAATASETDVADTDEERWDGRPRIFGKGWGRQPEDCGWWAVEPDVARMVDGSTRVVDRGRRVAALGNAVVPQAAEWIGARLLESISAGALGEETAHG